MKIRNNIKFFHDIFVEFHVKRGFFTALIIILSWSCSGKNHLANAIKMGDMGYVKSVVNVTDLNRFVDEKDKPVHLAIREGKLGIALLIFKKGINYNSLNRNGDTPLHLSSERGYLKFSKLLVRKGVHIDPVNLKGLTPLHLAVLNNHEKMVRFLIANGAKTNKIVPKTNYNKNIYKGETALSLAIKYSNEKITRLLIENSDPNKRATIYYYPLDIAINSGNYKAAKLLLKKGADPNIKKYNPFLFRSVKKSKNKIFKLLIDNGASLWDYTPKKPKNIFFTIIKQKKKGFFTELSPDSFNMKEKKQLFRLSLKNGFTEGVKFFYSPDTVQKASNYLNDAVEREYIDLVKFLIEKVAFFDSLFTICTAFEKSPEIALVLLNSGKIDPNIKSVDGFSLLHHAAVKSDIRVVKKLISIGADINYRSRNNITPLISSFYNKNPEIFKLLIESGADIRTPVGRNLSLVFYASKAGNLEALKYLVKKGLSLNIKDTHGSYPFFFTSEKKVMEYFFENGFDPNYINRDGHKVLYYSMFRGDLDCVKYLVENGCDYSVFKGLRNGPEYLRIAVAIRRKDLIDYLIKKGADINEIDQKGDTLLHFAIKAGRNNIAIFLIEDKNPSLNKKDNQLMTPLLLACMSKKPYFLLIKKLINYGAELDAVNKSGNTALHELLLKRKNDNFWYGSYESCLKLFVNKGADISIKNKENMTPFDIARKRKFIGLSRVFVKKK